ncbi:MAG: hypothetical protein JW982_00200 [Spirochaetes bacterium]|nr:hypothetical protein [Spirochaetota bacterium]
MNNTIIQIILIFWSSILLWIILEYLFYRLNSSHDEIKINNTFAAKNKN